MTSPQTKYLRDVLGIRSVILSESESPNLALVSDEPTSAVKDLVAKMFGSVGISDFRLMSVSGLSPEELQKLTVGKKLVWSFGSALSSANFQLPSIDELLSDQQAKRRAWNLIKVLKK